MVAPLRHYLVEGIIVAGIAYSLELLYGNHRSEFPGSDDSGTSGVAPCL
jgi:NADH:ubiquinone oxidoreductase subunit F (NADH-binding)